MKLFVDDADDDAELDGDDVDDDSDDVVDDDDESETEDGMIVGSVLNENILGCSSAALARLNTLAICSCSS
jgi:hypothetical protein